jgi:hypothetical protein
MKPAIINNNEQGLEKWFDNQEIMQRLRISLLTLHRWQRLAHIAEMNQASRFMFSV